MGFSYEQARVLGLAEFHPDHPAERRTRPLVEPADARPPGDGMNGLERRFRDEILEPAVLSRRIIRWAREPVKLRLGGRCWYTPDFLVVLGMIPAAVPHVREAFVETKGNFPREDSIVKIKVAASLYPEFGWYIAYRGRGRAAAWKVYAVTARGISVNPVAPAWMGETP